MKNIILLSLVVVLFSCGSGNSGGSAKSDSTASAAAPAVPPPPALPLQNQMVMHPGNPTPPDSIHTLAATNLKSSVNFMRATNNNQMKFHKVEVFYGTDRQRSAPNDKIKYYGSKRNESNKYEVGVIEISIPHDHEVGKIEKAPGWKLWDRNNATKYVLGLGLTPLDYDTFCQRIKKIVDSSDEKDEFIFIHGYNNSFEDAAKRTAQLAFDLGFKGAPIMFSWPSSGTTGGYLADEDAVQWAVPHLNDFLSRIITQTGAKKIHVIAHSMGNRALTAVLMSMESAHPGILFDQIILAAPDIDSAIFKRDIAPKILTISNRITLYASSHDKALIASKDVHHDIRAGEGGKHVFISNGIETIDATDLKIPDFLDHSYFAESRPLLDDISKLFEFNAPPEKRNLLSQIIPIDLKYWLFKK